MHHQVLRPLLRYRWAGPLALSVMLIVVLLGAQTCTGQTQLSAEAATAPTPSAPQSAAAPPPPAPASPELVSHTAHQGRFVALTFDDGPHPSYTPQVLALLAQHHAVATFCMVGMEVREHPELVREVVAAGMRLCDHTVTHDQHLRDRPEQQIEAEIVGGRDALREAAGPDVPIDYFRAPAGRWSEQIQQVAAGNGMQPLAWSVDPRDWSRPGTDQIVAAVQQQTEPGAVILLHDGGGRRDQTVAALARLLPWFAEQGYEFDLPG